MSFEPVRTFFTKRTMRFIALIAAFAIYATAGGQCLSGNCLDGTGSSVITPGIIYKGSFRNGLPNGKGIFYNRDFVIYEGEVKDGLYQGKGTLYYENGSVYTGEFRKGLREGQGEYHTLKETFKGRFHLNGYGEKFRTEDPANGTGIYTVYGDAGFVYTTRDKVAVYTGFECSIFDAGTGRLLEVTPLPDFRDQNGTCLYLDYGARFYDTIKHKWKLPLELNNYDYWGRNENGDPIFSESVYGPKSTILSCNIATLTAGNEVSKLTSFDFSAHKMNYSMLKAVALNLSRVVVNNRVFAPGDKKGKVLEGVPEDATIIFSDSGDSLRVFVNGRWQLYSALSGKKLADIPLAVLPGAEDRIPTRNFYSVIRKLGTLSCGLIYIEDVRDTNNVLPLINPDLNYTDALAAYESAKIREMETSQASKEKDRERFESELDYKYEPGWRTREIKERTSNAKPAPTYRKCPFCNGSGVITIPGSGTSLEQDKGTLRWYKVVGSDKGSCPMCKGKGFL